MIYSDLNRERTEPEAVWSYDDGKIAAATPDFSDGSSLVALESESQLNQTSKSWGGLSTKIEEVRVKEEEEPDDLGTRLEDQEEDEMCPKRKMR
ncbi:unnamed protein product [Microthlaspi erraticum]|uniref:Uncharacterized protein n=1 Tax=Microthlaspi erraticum TaxID=1685480 RepID=A0A6D2K248_9BRAS|nr:unnamed protein product [Microthlaspi erraticum]